MFGRLPPEIKLIQKQKEGRNYSRDDEIHIVCAYISTNQTDSFNITSEHSIWDAVGWPAALSHLRSTN
jgi:hypothetical protein